VLAGSGIIDPTNIDEYIARGGYSSMAWTLKNKTSQEVCDLVEKSGLRAEAAAVFRQVKNGNSRCGKRPTRNTLSATPTKATPALLWTGQSRKRPASAA